MGITPEQYARRQQELLRIREAFAPALAPNEILVGALSVTPFDLSNPSSPAAIGNSLVATGKALTGNNQGRVLLLTDRNIHVARRKFWKTSYRGVDASYPVRSVPIRREGNGIRVADKVYYPNWTGFQTGGARGVVGTVEDLQLLLAASL